MVLMINDRTSPKTNSEEGGQGKVGENIFQYSLYQLHSDVDKKHQTKPGCSPSLFWQSAQDIQTRTKGELTNTKREGAQYALLYKGSLR